MAKQEAMGVQMTLVNPLPSHGIPACLGTDQKAWAKQARNGPSAYKSSTGLRTKVTQPPGAETGLRVSANIREQFY